VVVAEGLGAIEITALTASLRDELSSYKVPRHLRIMEERDLPKLPTGKVDLASLRDLVEGA
jgi:acyl-CoA synthetase (AMP-forming)/AMP-acid ligase II